MLDESPAANLLRAWQQGQAPELDAFVAGLSRVSPRELAALIRIDIDARCRRSDRRPSEEYLLRFSRVAADEELALDVIYAEYLAREQAGERPELAEYQARFPEFAQVLAEQVRLHHAFDVLDDDPNDDDAVKEDRDDEHPHDTEIDSVGAPSLQASADTLAGLERETSYEILEQIGSGGMGVVYKARQPALNRFVALKMVRAIDASNRELLGRFRAEARVVASLHHPHIVQVYDYGEHDDLPYLAMELIEGGSLADRLDGTPWSPRAAAALVVKLAAAVHYAHQRQVIHRDLKPANVLVVSESQELEVKITDFGLAKFLAEDTSPHTRSYAFLGTPSYMAPEQASGRPNQVGPAADVYALGAILYELLTGQPPVRGVSPIETLRLLLATGPVAAHRFDVRIPRDVATICNKCLQGDPTRRYASAAELRDDLNRYLEGLPIQARRVGNLERAWRWCRRNPLLAASLGSVAMLLVGIAAVSLWYSAQLSRELTRTRRVEHAERAANQSAQRRLWDAYLSEAAARNGSRHVGQRFAALESIDQAAALLTILGRNADRELQLRNAVLACVTLPDLRTIRAIAEWPVSPHAADMSLSADRYVVTSHDGTVTVYRLSNGERLWTGQHAEPFPLPTLSRDGRWLATIGAAHTKVWRLSDGPLQPAWEAAGGTFYTFAPDGEHAAYSTADGMRLAHIDTGETVRKLGTGPAHSRFAFADRHGHIAVCGPNSVQIIAADSGEIVSELPRGKIEPSLAWQPGGEHLAVWRDSEAVELWNVKSRKQVLSFPHPGMPSKLQFNEQGSILATQSLWDNRLLVWEVGTGQRLLDVREFDGYASDADTSGAIQFLTTHAGKTVLTEVSPGACHSLAQALHVPLGYWHKTSISPEGRIAAFASNRGFELWDMQTTRRLWSREIGVCTADFDDSGGLIVGHNSGVYRFARVVQKEPPAVDERAAKSRGARTTVHYGSVERLTNAMLPPSLAVSASGNALACQLNADWHVLRGDNLTRIKTQSVWRKSAIRNDHRFVAIANWDIGGAGVWDAATGDQIARLDIGRCGVLQFSPDGKWLAATPDGVTLWQTGDWRQTRQLHAQGTTPAGMGIAFSPDSRVLAVGQVNGVLSLVDPDTGAPWAQLAHRDFSAASVLAFSPNQRWLVTSSINERSPAQVWDLEALRRELAVRDIDLPQDVLRVRPNEEGFAEQVEVSLDDAGLLGGETVPESP